MKRLVSYLLLSVALHAGVGWLLHAMRVKPEALAWQAPITIQLVSVAQAALPQVAPPVRPAPARQEAAQPSMPKATVKPEPTPALVKPLPVTPTPAIAKSAPPPRPAQPANAPAASAPTVAPALASKSHPAPVAKVAAPPLPTTPVLSLRPSFVSPPPPPRYPSVARRRNQQGVVRVEVCLDDRGQQLKRTVIRSSGVESLDQAALDAVTQWRFRPEIVDGRAVPSRVEIPIEFALTANR